jgi:hypothetical protein
MNDERIAKRVRRIAAQRERTASTTKTKQQPKTKKLQQNISSEGGSWRVPPGVGRGFCTAVLALRVSGAALCAHRPRRDER